MGCVLSFKQALYFVASLGLIIPVTAIAQGTGQLRTEAKVAAGQMRASGELRDRCSLGTELQRANVVSRVLTGSIFNVGDHLLSINGTDVVGKEVSAVIAVLERLLPDAQISVIISRAGATIPLHIACISSKLISQPYLAALDQAATGNFKECADALGEPINYRYALLKQKCVASVRKPDPKIVGQATFTEIRFGIEDAVYLPATRIMFVERLHSDRDALIQTLGAGHFEELVYLTRKWPGGEKLFENSEPDWAVFRRNGEQAVQKGLSDPYSAMFEWPHGFYYGTWKPFLSKRIEGYVTCALVNARNRMGGYTGATTFVVVLDRGGNHLYSELGSGGDGGLVANLCAKAANMFPPAPAELASGTKMVGEPAASLGDEVKKLADLRASGALTDSEFQVAKSKVLGSQK